MLMGYPNERLVMSLEIIREANGETREPAVGKCACGQEVWLSGFTNTCDGCGRDYSIGGQELAPREQWGEETGESASDILSVDYGDGWDPGHPGGDGFFD